MIGKCDYENLINIIKYTTMPIPYSERHNYQLPTLKDGGMMDLYQFPKLKLLLYIYDQRGGILVSENNDKKRFKYIFDEIEKSNKHLLNNYWYGDMVTKLNSWSKNFYFIKIEKSENNNYNIING